MEPTARHATAETHFRSLLDEAGLEPPDRVGYEEQGLVFYWDAQQLAVHVDFDDALQPR